MIHCRRLRVVLLPVAVFLVSSGRAAGAEVPEPVDSRLAIDLFAEHPQIVTPTGIAVDARGRVFVAESHTHFRPEDYDGPSGDRILILADGDGDGRADRRSIFHEGYTHVMDIEFHHDGSLYVATRMDIHRMRDTDGDDRADEITPILRMETAGTYPHNGLSGLAFDLAGDLHFGLGENLGHAYTLVGSDGVRLGGGGEGGSTYHMRANGAGLRRVSTGWWNPFGMGVDAFGRVFGTDNDPGASPPCRLIQVVEGGDYGYEYRYGRTGLHPLITWTGDIPGTLPMVAGTGEAPCAIVAYESDALPEEYLGSLLVASWADHRVERYPITQPADAGLVATRRQTLVGGGNEFRPVGLAVAPDGTVYISDWVSRSYTLHRQGRIWRLRPSRRPPPLVRPAAAQRALLARDRRWREAAARKLAATGDGRMHLRKQLLRNPDPRVRATALQALVMAGDPEAEYDRVTREDDLLANRALALRHLLSRGEDAAAWCGAEIPLAVRVEAIRRLDPADHGVALGKALRSRDPRMFHAAVEALSRRAHEEGAIPREIAGDHPLALLLARKRNPVTRSRHPETELRRFLDSPDSEVRFAAVKWVADDRLESLRPRLRDLLRDESLDVRLFLAITAALDRLDGKNPVDRPARTVLLEMIRAADTPASLIRLSLRLLDPGKGKLPVRHLVRLLDHRDPVVRLEAVRVLASHPGDGPPDLLAEVAGDRRRGTEVRAAAIAGLAGATGERVVELLLGLARHEDRAISDEALRALVGADLDPRARETLDELARRRPEAAEAVRRILDGSPGPRPAAEDLDRWLELLEGPGDPQAGERIFFGRSVGACSRCHSMEGRGRAVGPDLSRIGRRVVSRAGPDRRWLLETVLQPGREMAPQYTPWTILTTDGGALVGLPRRKGGNAEAYLGVDGEEFSVKKDRIIFHREMSTSLMPADLLQQLTARELRDLFAYLTRVTSSRPR